LAVLLRFLPNILKIGMIFSGGSDYYQSLSISRARIDACDSGDARGARRSYWRGVYAAYDGNNRGIGSALCVGGAAVASNTRVMVNKSRRRLR